MDFRLTHTYLTSVIRGRLLIIVSQTIYAPPKRGRHNDNGTMSARGNRSDAYTVGTSPIWFAKPLYIYQYTIYRHNNAEILLCLIS